MILPTKKLDYRCLPAMPPYGPAAFVGFIGEHFGFAPWGWNLYWSAFVVLLAWRATQHLDDVANGREIIPKEFQ